MLSIDFSLKRCTWNSLSCEVWLTLCAEILEAVAYLHDEASLLHNNIKLNNILIAKTTDFSKYQAIVIDFGKATHKKESKHCRLNGIKQLEYLHKFPHIPPEVVEGKTCQTTYSEMYAYGKLLFCLINHGIFDALSALKKQLLCFAEQCVAPNV